MDFDIVEPCAIIALQNIYIKWMLHVLNKLRLYGELPCSLDRQNLLTLWFHYSDSIIFESRVDHTSCHTYLCRCNDQSVYTGTVQWLRFGTHDKDSVW